MMKYLFYIASLLLIISCESNELPPDELNDEVQFFTQGSLNGQPFDLNAGPNDIIVESDTEFSEGDFPLFNIGFFNLDCEECHDAIFIQISGNEEYTSGAELEDLITEGSYNIIEPVDEDENQGVEIFLEEGEFIITDLQNNIEITENGIYDLDPGFYEYTVTTGDSFDDCQSQISGGIYISPDGDICMPQVHFESLDDDILIDFSDFGEQEMMLEINGVEFTIDTEEEIFLEELVSQTGFDELNTLLITSLSLDEECFFFPVFYAYNSVNDEICEYDFSVEEASIPAEVQSSSVSILYQSDEGDLYFSVGNEEIDFFQIHELEPYENDPLGREAFRARVSFHATLFNFINPTDQVVLEIEEAFIPLVLE